MMKFILSLILIGFCLEALAKESYELGLSSKIKNIRVEVQNAHIQLYAQKQATKKTKKTKKGKKTKKVKQTNKKGKLKIKYADTLNIDEQATTLIVSEKHFPNKKTAWKHQNKPQVMQVWLPENLALKLILFKGKVETKKGNLADLSISILGQGDIKLKNTRGILNIFQGEGSIAVNSHKGDLVIQSENSKVHLKSCTGKMSINSFKGRLEVSKSSGHLNLNTFKSPLILNKFTGQLDFQQEKGGIYLRPMIGSISGYSKEGEVRGRIQPNNVNIETKTAGIQLNLPYSKSWVTAETWEGRLFTPNYFSRIKTGGMDRAKGRLRAGKKRVGNVSLKSHSGSIRFYQSAQ